MIHKLHMLFFCVIYATRLYLHVITTLREEHIQIIVILQQKLPAAILSAVCTIYKQWLVTSGCKYGLRITVKTQDTIPYFSYPYYCF